MKSRYGFWILSICWIGMAGCSNWQNRMNNIDGPGSAASLTAASNGPLIQNPGVSFGEPPPPVPPLSSDPGQSLAPLGGAPPQRLDLSAAESPASPRPEKMYNLQSSRNPTPGKEVASSAEPAPKRSSTISRLADKAKVDDRGSKQSAESKPRVSTLDRLSADASGKTQTKAESKSASEPAKSETSSDSNSTPKSTSPDSAQVMDTTLLAQPVRKGAGNDDSGDSSKGPQSNLMQGENTLLNGKSKPAIYPVSNPVSEEPVDTTQFS